MRFMPLKIQVEGLVSFKPFPEGGSYILGFERGRGRVPFWGFNAFL